MSNKKIEKPVCSEKSHPPDPFVFLIKFLVNIFLFPSILYSDRLNLFMSYYINKFKGN